MTNTGAETGRVLIAGAGSTLAHYVGVLGAEGFAVEEAKSGAAALQRIHQGGIHVALIDDDLPDVSGLDLLRAAGHAVPIIICSASWNVTRAVQAMKEGAFDYLTRPLTPKDLLHAVTAVMRQRASAPAANPAAPGSAPLGAALVSDPAAPAGLAAPPTPGSARVSDPAASPTAGLPAPPPVRSSAKVSGAGVSAGAGLPAPLDERRCQAHKMELFGRLAGGVIHDFNNILTIILGYCELLKNGLPPGHAMRAHVDEMDRVAANGAALTRQLLAFSRNQVLAPRTIDLNQMLPGMEVMLGRLLGEHIRVRLRPARDLGLVCAVPSQLEQVLLNLVVNARDAMPKGGELIIETANCDLSTPLGPLAPGSYVVLEVADTGCGMDDATRAHLFQPFFTTKPQEQGTGLGLAIVAGIIHQRQGHITVSSSPGKGTTFTTYLPRVPPEPRGGMHPASAHIPTGQVSNLSG